ncbi:hypothetical protein Tco_0105154 [Tanacetum coccineum]
MLKSVNIKVGEFIEFCTVSVHFHVNVVALALSLPSQSRSDIGCAGPESTKPGRGAMEGEGDVVLSVGDVCLVMCVGNCWSGGGGWWHRCLVVAVRDGDDEDGGEVE